MSIVYYWIYMIWLDVVSVCEVVFKLVEECLCGCVNIFLGVEFIYLWEGKIEYEQEVVMIFKMFVFLFVCLNVCIGQLYFYDILCIIVLLVVMDVSVLGYFVWLV